MITIANIRPFGHNVGNQAISFAIKNILHDVCGRLVTIIDYPATSKYESGAKGGLTSGTIHEINRFADGVIVGGGNLFENNEIDIDPNALLALQPPLMLFSNSRGRIYNRYSQLSDRSDVISDSKLYSLLSRADLSLSRDSATHSYLKKIDARDRMGWCPTININRYKNQIPRLPESEDVGVIISVRTPNLMNIPYKFQSRIQSQIESTINKLRDLGHRRIRILCNDSRDLDFATLFRDTKGVDSIYTNDVYQYLALLKDASLVVSYRLHATLPSISFGTPTINIVYDERAQSLFDDLGLSSEYLDMVKLDDNFLVELERQIIKGGYSSSDHRSCIEAWDKISQEQYSAFKEFIALVHNYLKIGRESIIKKDVIC